MANKQTGFTGNQAGKKAGDGLRPIEKGWMKYREISFREYGTCNVVVIAPHGFPGDDDNIERLGFYLAEEELKAYAVINNQKCMRPENKGDGAFVGDLNVPDDAKKTEEFWEAVTRFATKAFRDYDSPAIVIVLHGMKDSTAKSKAGKGGVFLLGAGYENKYDPEFATVWESTRNALMKHLLKGIGPGKDGVHEYAATQTIVPEIVDSLRFPVEAFQLELPWTNFRDNEDNIEKAAKRLALVLRKLPSFVTAADVQARREKAQREAASKQQADQAQAAEDTGAQGSSAGEEVDQRLVDETLKFIIGKYNEAGRISEEIGLRIYDTFFEHDPARVSARNPYKEASFRQLCDHPDLPAHPSTLNKMVRIVIDRDFLSAEGMEVDKLGHSQRLELLRLHDGQKKLELAKKAIDENLTVAELRRQVDHAKAELGQQTGAIPNLAVDFTKNPFSLLGNSKRMDFLSVKENLKRLTSGRRKRLSQESGQIRTKLSEYDGKLAAIQEFLEEIAQEESGN